MKYYYEYKEKNGCTVGGHNLIEIKINDGYIKLMGIDIINEISYYWSTMLDMKEIEYLKIEPMIKKEND